jgi:teichuronic acid biosynthesis glycosyltransferase TuaC
MRILTFTSLFPDALHPRHGLFVYQRMAAVAARGHHVEVVAPRPYLPRWWRAGRRGSLSGIPKQEQIGSLQVHHPRYGLIPKISMPLHGLLLVLGCHALVRRLHTRVGFDCIDAHYVYPDGFAATVLGSLLDIPVVVSARGTDIDQFPSFRLIRGQIRRTLRRASGIVAVSHSLKRGMTALGAPPGLIRVIPNGIDSTRFAPLERGEARRSLGLTDQARIVVSVGSLTPSKGHHRLLEAAGTILSRIPTLQVFIIGEGPLRRPLQDVISRTGLAGRAHLIGARPNEELRQWFSAADVACLASDREGWPNALVESLACGTPVVATRVGGIPEIVTSPIEGILVEPNTDALAIALVTSLQTPRDSKLVSHRIRARTWDVVAVEVESWLEATIRRYHDKDLSETCRSS